MSLMKECWNEVFLCFSALKRNSVEKTSSLQDRLVKNLEQTVLRLNNLKFWKNLYVNINFRDSFLFILLIVKHSFFC